MSTTSRPMTRASAHRAKTMPPPAMPRTSGFVGVSLDGFLARRDGAIDWLAPYEGVEHGYRAFFDSIDCIVVGRKTYEFVLGMVASGHAWPYAGKRCVVMTHRAIEARNQ